MMELESADYVSSIIGERGTGKSTRAIYQARNLRRQMGSYIIGHSPAGAIGHWPDVMFHDSLKSLENGLAKKPMFMHFIASGPSPEEVMQFGRAMALEIRKRAIKDAGFKFQANRPPPPGVFAPPVHIVIDEGTHLEKNPQHRDKTPGKFRLVTDAQLEQFLTNLRHEHVTMSWLIQAPTRRNWVYMEQANRFNVFRYVHEWGHNAIRAAGIPKEVIAQIKALPDFRYYSWDKDDPNGGKFVTLPPPD